MKRGLFSPSRSPKRRKVSDSDESRCHETDSDILQDVDCWESALAWKAISLSATTGMTYDIENVHVEQAVVSFDSTSLGTCRLEDARTSRFKKCAQIQREMKSLFGTPNENRPTGVSFVSLDLNFEQELMKQQIVGNERRERDRIQSIKCFLRFISPVQPSWGPSKNSLHSLDVDYPVLPEGLGKLPTVTNRRQYSHSLQKEWSKLHENAVLWASDMKLWKNSDEGELDQKKVMPLLSDAYGTQLKEIEYIDVISAEEEEEYRMILASTPNLLHAHSQLEDLEEVSKEESDASKQSNYKSESFAKSDNEVHEELHIPLDIFPQPPEVISWETVDDQASEILEKLKLSFQRKVQEAQNHQGISEGVFNECTLEDEIPMQSRIVREDNELPTGGRPYFEQSSEATEPPETSKATTLPISSDNVLPKAFPEADVFFDLVALEEDESHESNSEEGDIGDDDFADLLDDTAQDVDLVENEILLREKMAVDDEERYKKLFTMEGREEPTEHRRHADRLYQSDVESDSSSDEKVEPKTPVVFTYPDDRSDGVDDIVNGPTKKIYGNYEGKLVVEDFEPYSSANTGTKGYHFVAESIIDFGSDTD